MLFGGSELEDEKHIPRSVHITELAMPPGVVIPRRYTAPFMHARDGLDKYESLLMLDIGGIQRVHITIKLNATSH